MSGRNISTCHKARVSKCKGCLDPKEKYGKWAYWCKDDFRWRAEPCVHKRK